MKVVSVTNELGSVKTSLASLLPVYSESYRSRCGYCRLRGEGQRQSRDTLEGGREGFSSRVDL